MALGPAYGDGFAGISNDTAVPALYLTGNQFTDGSLRLIPAQRGQSNKFDVAFRHRQNGVWNDTGLRVAGESVSLGRDLTISAVGPHAGTFDQFREQLATVLAHHYDDANGSDTHPMTLVLAPKVVRFVFISNESFERVDTEISWTTTPGQSSVVASKVYFKLGSVPATAPITYTLSRGTVDGGDIFFTKVLPTALFAGAAGSEISFDLEGLTQTVPGSEVFIKINSAATFSLKAEGTSPGDFPWQAVDFSQFTEEKLLTETLVLANDLGIAFDNAGNMVRHNFEF